MGTRGKGGEGGSRMVLVNMNPPDHVSANQVSQELIKTRAAVCRRNAFLHGAACARAERVTCFRPPHFFPFQSINEINQCP